MPWVQTCSAPITLDSVEQPYPGILAWLWPYLFEALCHGLDQLLLIQIKATYPHLTIAIESYLVYKVVYLVFP